MENRQLRTIENDKGIIDFEGDRITLEEETHTYYLDGVEIPNQISGTSLIKNLGDINAYPEIAKKKANLSDKGVRFMERVQTNMDNFFKERMDRGTRVHEDIEHKRNKEVEDIIRYSNHQSFGFKEEGELEFRELRVLYKEVVNGVEYNIVGTIDYVSLMGYWNNLNLSTDQRTMYTLDAINIIDFKVSRNVQLYKPYGNLQTKLYGDIIIDILDSNRDAREVHQIRGSLSEDDVSRNILMIDLDTNPDYPSYMLIDYYEEDFSPGSRISNFFVEPWAPPSKENKWTKAYEHYKLDIKYVKEFLEREKEHFRSMELDASKGVLDKYEEDLKGMKKAEVVNALCDIQADKHEDFDYEAGAKKLNKKTINELRPILLNAWINGIVDQDIKEQVKEIYEQRKASKTE